MNKDNIVLSKWVSQLGTSNKFSTKKIRDLFIPGSHDSGAYMSTFSPQMRTSYEFIKYIPIINKIFELWYLNQHYNIKEQLHIGVRSFDLRISIDEKDVTKKWYITHMFNCVDLDTILDDIFKFALLHKELIILNISPDTNNYNENIDIIAFNEKLNKYLSNYVTINTIYENLYTTDNKLLDENLSYFYQNNDDNLNKNNRILVNLNSVHVWPNTLNFDDVVKEFDKNICKHVTFDAANNASDNLGNSIVHFDCVLTPKMEYIIGVSFSSLFICLFVSFFFTFIMMTIYFVVKYALLTNVSLHDIAQVQTYSKSLKYTNNQIHENFIPISTMDIKKLNLNKIIFYGLVINIFVFILLGFFYLFTSMYSLKSLSVLSKQFITNKLFKCSKETASIETLKSCVISYDYVDDATNREIISQNFI